MPNAEIRESNSDTLWIVGFNTAVAGTTVLLSQNQPSRVVAGIATGLSAISPLLYLGRFFNGGTPERVSAQLGVPTQITLVNIFPAGQAASARPSVDSIQRLE